VDLEKYLTEERQASCPVIAINVPLILNAGDYYFFRAYLHYGPFQEIFLRVKKVEALSKYPEKWPTK
jgi:hypothetical protein